MSGLPYTLVSLRKLPISALTTWLSIVLTSLAFKRSNLCNPNVSWRYPLTYAEPGCILTVKKSSWAGISLSVLSPTLYSPKYNSFPIKLSTVSATFNLNGFTI